MNFDDAFAAIPAHALDIARRCEFEQALIGATTSELNLPSLQKLRRVLDQRNIPYNNQSLEKNKDEIKSKF